MKKRLKNNRKQTRLDSQSVKSVFQSSITEMEICDSLFLLLTRKFRRELILLHYTICESVKTDMALQFQFKMI